MPRSEIGHLGTRRLLSRLFIEYRADGWTVQALCRESGIHRSVVDRWFSDRVTHPLLNLYVALVEAMGKRVDIVSEHHVPLLTLNEFEAAALIEAAYAHWGGIPMQSGIEHLGPALTKLETIKTEANPDA